MQTVIVEYQANGTPLPVIYGIRPNSLSDCIKVVLIPVGHQNAGRPELNEKN